MTPANEQNLPRVERLPWSLVAAALVAIAALYFTVGQADQDAGTNAAYILVGLACLFVLSQLVDWRLPFQRTVSLALRAVLLTLIIVWMGWPDAQFNGWYLKPAYTNLAGAILVAELTVRAWE